MFALAVAAAFACAAVPTAPTHTIRIQYPLSGNPIGRWTAGTLVGWQQPAPVVHAHDCLARQIANITVRVPEASRFRLNRAIRAADGSFAAVGMADIASGAGAYIWRISADGESQRAIPTAPYGAKDVAVAPDGFIWTSGIQKQTVRMSYEDYAENHDIVRRYTPDGRPAGSWLPWKSVKTKDGLHPGQASMIFASADRVGWYPVRAGEYVEFSFDGQILNRYPTAPAGSGQQFGGAALCDGGALFVGRTTRDTDGATIKWEVLRLDRDAGTWRVVAGAPQRGGWLYGCEGSRLVTWSPGERDAIELDFWQPDAGR